MRKFIRELFDICGGIPIPANSRSFAETKKVELCDSQGGFLILNTKGNAKIISLLKKEVRKLNRRKKKNESEKNKDF